MAPAVAEEEAGVEDEDEGEVPEQQKERLLIQTLNLNPVLLFHTTPNTT